MFLDNLPMGDLLAEIDKGCCLMNLGDYEKARDCYRNILSDYQETPYRLRNT